MNQTNDPDLLCLGRPEFLDPELARLQTGSGDAAAWREAFARSGPNAPAGVRGDFAVAVREPSGRCFLAVDRFAIHSLCYRVVGNRLRFAERADDLADDSTTIDPQAIFDFLYFHAIPSPRTIFKGVYRLPPAHCARFENGRLSVAPYWKPVFAEPRNVAFEPLRDEFRQLVQDAVGRRLDAGKAACFLSGGTDSSTVAGMIGEVRGEPAATYSIGFEAEGYDEMEYARVAARRYGTQHHEYYVTHDDLVRSIPAVAAYYDQPFGNSSALPAYYCARMAAADGVTRILAGDGGDELFGGNTRYAKQRVFGWYGAFPPAMRARVLEPLFGRSAVGRLPLARKVASYIDQAQVPMPDRIQTYNLIMRLGITDVLSPEFLAGVDLAEPLEHQRAVWREIGPCSLVNHQLAFDWRYTLAENDLPKVCGTTRLAGIEVGFPLLDDRLLDFSLRLPSNYKLRGLKLRWFFKEALRGFLPDEIITKKKHGFGLPFGVWVAKHPSLQALARDSVEGLARRGILRPEFVALLFDRYLNEHPGYYGEMIWISMMLEQWLRAWDSRRRG